jgi:hypothetical protein
MKTLNGSCHCGALHVALETRKAAAELPARSCQCGFCTRHGALNTSDPEGFLHITAAPGSLSRYRFGRGQIDMLLCVECGCYVAAVQDLDGGEMIGTVNVIGTKLEGFDGRSGEPMDYEDETDEARLMRRRAKWSPATVTETAPSA